MPTCPHCGKFTSFADYGIDNILEGEDAEEFWRNEQQPATPEQIAAFREAIEFYRAHKTDFYEQATN